MVKKILLTFLILSLFVFSFWFFLPKKNLYYELEHLLYEQGIVIENETLSEHPFSLEITDADLYFQGIKVAKISSLSINITLLFNSLHAKDIHCANIAKTFIPTRIESVDINYNIIKPLFVSITAYGEFGKLNGGANIKQRKGAIQLKPSKLMEQKYKKLLYKLKKTQGGAYSYVKNF